MDISQTSDVRSGENATKDVCSPLVAIKCTSATKNLLFRKRSETLPQKKNALSAIILHGAWKRSRV